LRHGRVEAAVYLGGFYVLFQLGVASSVITYPEPSAMVGDPLTDRITSFARSLATVDAYVNPLAVLFLYVAVLKWVLVDRRLHVRPVTSAVFFLLAGTYYGIFFVGNLNGNLHHAFDSALGVNPAPLWSALFPLSIAFVIPLVVTLLLRIHALRSLSD